MSPLTKLMKRTKIRQVARMNKVKNKFFFKKSPNPKKSKPKTKNNQFLNKTNKNIHWEKLLKYYNKP